MTLYFAFFCAVGRPYVEAVTIPPGADPDIWLRCWCEDRLYGGCKQIEPITPERYRELLRSKKA